MFWLVGVRWLVLHHLNPSVLVFVVVTWWLCCRSLQCGCSVVVGAFCGSVMDGVGWFCGCWWISCVMVVRG